MLIIQQCVFISCSYTAPATGHTAGPSSRTVGTVFQQLMDKYQPSTTAQASEPKKEDPSSLSPPPGVVNQYGCVSVQLSSILAVVPGLLSFIRSL